MGMKPPSTSKAPSRFHILDAKVCNCSQCEAMLTTTKEAVGRIARIGLVHYVLQACAGWLQGRPWCYPCLHEEYPTHVPSRGRGCARAPGQQAKLGHTIGG